MQNCRALELRGSFNLVTLSNNLVTLSEAKGPVISCIAVTPACHPRLRSGTGASFRHLVQLSCPPLSGHRHIDPFTS